MNKKSIKLNYKDTEILISSNIRENSDNWIICLHGLQTNKSMYNPIFSVSDLNKYSILALDFVGFGDSSKPEHFSYSLGDQTEIILKIIKNIKPKKLNLIGHSLGGMIGTLLLEKTNINSFINLEGNLIFQDCGASNEVNQLRFDEFQHKYYPQLKKELKNSKTYNAILRSSSLEKIPDFVFFKSSQSIVKLSKSNLLKKFIELPDNKLYIYGDKNKEKINSLPKNFETASIKNSGHFMLLDNPQESLKKIIEFLKKN
tara:strand:- start:2111 stop:2884 length:774 start_codon:yes stop_codon:yes gene_type:complete